MTLNVHKTLFLTAFISSNCMIHAFNAAFTITTNKNLSFQSKKWHQSSAISGYAQLSTILFEGSSKNEILEDANEALASVGWSRPLDDGEMTSEDPFVKRIDAEIQKDFGVGLDELLNPAKVRFCFLSFFLYLFWFF